MNSGWELARVTGAELCVGDLTRPDSAGSLLAHCVSKSGRVDALFVDSLLLVRTPVSRPSEDRPELLELIRKKQPLAGGMIDAEDVARAAIFLLSEEARSHHRRGASSGCRLEGQRSLKRRDSSWWC